MAEQVLIRRITAAEYDATYPETMQPMELIDGFVISYPSPEPLHQHIIVELIVLLAPFIKEAELGELAVSPNDVHFDEYTVLQPDLFFVAKDSPTCAVIEDRWRGAPNLCIEILSPSTAKRDRETKRHLYAGFGVAEYWIIDPLHQTIEVFNLAEAVYQLSGVYGAEDNLKSTVLTGLDLALSDLFTAQT